MKKYFIHYLVKINPYHLYFTRFCDIFHYIFRKTSLFSVNFVIAGIRCLRIRHFVSRYAGIRHRPITHFIEDPAYFPEIKQPGYTESCSEPE